MPRFCNGEATFVGTDKVIVFHAFAVRLGYQPLVQAQLWSCRYGWSVVTVLPLGIQTWKVTVVPALIATLPTDADELPDDEPLKFTASD